MTAKSNAAHAPLAAWPEMACLAMALGFGALLFLVDPSHCPFYPQCLFHQLTGWNCPGCGSLRGLHQLLRGHLLLALRCNALLMLSLPFAAVYAARQFSRRWAGLPLSVPEIRPRWVFLMTSVLVVFTVVRNIPASPFIYLSPP